MFFLLSWNALVVVFVGWVTTTFALPWERNCQLFPSLSSCCICRAVTSVQSICINWNWMHQVDWIGACTRHQHTLALRTKHEHEKIHSPKERWKVRGKALFFCNNHKLWNYFTCTDNSNFPTGQSGLAVLTITKVPSCLCAAAATAREANAKHHLHMTLLIWLAIFLANLWLFAWEPQLAHILNCTIYEAVAVKLWATFLSNLLKHRCTCRRRLSLGIKTLSP